MTKPVTLLALLMTILAAPARIVVGPWSPIFKGVDHAVGQTIKDATDVRQQAVTVMRLDLADPDVALFTDPPCTNCPPGYQTLGQTTSGFVEAFHLQGAINHAYFTDGALPGQPMVVQGLLISRGGVVQTNSPTRNAVLMFTTNKVPTFLPHNWPPASTTGIDIAIAGGRPLLTNGVVWAEDTDPQPRTAVGLSANGRYLFLLTIDGRQSPEYGFSYTYSEGASDAETAAWMLRFGAWNAIMVDGGGSTTMAMEQCAGHALVLGSPIEDGVPGRERVVSGHLGFAAKPLTGFISNVSTAPGSTTASVTWRTASNASSQVEYGLSVNYDYLTPLDAALVTNHVVTLNGLLPGSNYFFRVISQVGTNEFSLASCFTTTNPAVLIFGLTNVWKYSMNNLDGVNWAAAGYDDTAWPGGAGLLWADTRAAGSPESVQPKGQRLPPFYPDYPFTNYYFRTHFNFTNPTVGVMLTFSNYLDDGAAFYLNGVEIHRAFLPPGTLLNSTLATGYNCLDTGDATCPYAFNISGNLISNLVTGDNVLAVEVHNYTARSPDITFGTALFYTLPVPTNLPPFLGDLAAAATESTATITWTTLTGASSQVEYGLTDSLGLSSPLATALVTNHSVTLSNLSLLRTYYFRVVSAADGNQFTARGQFATVLPSLGLLSLTNVWRYTTNNLDGVRWPARDYDDSNWLGSGPALLCVEDNPEVRPQNTPLPGVSGALPPTYYFRTRFTLTNNPEGFSLVFSNYVDDGAVFYLNGTEIRRLRMASAPQPIFYTDLAWDAPAFGDAIASVPDVFQISGAMMTNLVLGENVLAAEVHQYNTGSSDIVFGSAVSLAREWGAETELRIAVTNGAVRISWPGSGVTLQEAHALDSPDAWHDVPGPVMAGPFWVTNSPVTKFYRLRN